jgi:hypothetical protein
MALKYRITDAQRRPQLRAKNFVERMERIPPAVRKRINAANEKSAEELAAMMVRLSPEPITGALTRSIRYYELATTEGGGVIWRVVAGNDEAFYARMVEHGTPNAAARPFFYVSYRALRRLIKRRQLSAFRAALKETKR